MIEGTCDNNNFPHAKRESCENFRVASPQATRPPLTEREWMEVANKNALEREKFADLARFYLDALEDIAEPMQKIQAEAQASGYRVNGLMANELCKDANWLRDKAREALKRSE